MAILHETERALTDLAANSMFGSGQHTDGLPQAGMDGVYIGTTAFDPSRHAATDIDPFSPMGMATGEDYVRNVLPGKPLTMNVVVDHTVRNEHPAVTRTKDIVAGNLLAAIEQALPGMSDRVYAYAVGESRASSLPRGAEVFGGDITEALEDLALNGLTFAISDFSPLKLGGSLRSKLANLVAVKVNHPAERAIPAGVGFVSLGGRQEVNTNNAKQLDAVNTRLEDQHQEIVGQLERAGAAVVSIITAHSQPNLYDTATTDQALAEAIRSRH